MERAADELLTAVERSPRAAAAHDRPGWVGLFTADGCVEDPVGSRPHVGHAEIGRFYDTFIGPRQITFHPEADIVDGTVVIRDVTLEVTMGPGVSLMVPTFIRYDLQASESGWKFSSLKAHWELPVMVTEFLRSGPRSVAGGTAVVRGAAAQPRVCREAWDTSARSVVPASGPSGWSSRRCRTASCTRTCVTASGAR